MAIETNADREAFAKGFTRRFHADGREESTEILCRPEVDLDSSFTAWATDWQEWTVVHGFNVQLEEMPL